MRLSPVRFSLVLALALAIAVPAGRADGLGLLAGRVVAADGSTPRAGVVVALFDESSDRVFRSAPSDESGAFRVEAAPADYALLAETGEGAFRAPGTLRVHDGGNRSVSLALRGARPGFATGPGGPTAPAAPVGMARWAKWTIAGTIAVGGLVFINEVTDDDEEPASAFVPAP